MCPPADRYRSGAEEANVSDDDTGATSTSGSDELGGEKPRKEDGHWGTEVPAGSGADLHPGDIVSGPEVRGGPDPIVGADQSTSLEDESDGVVPPSPLWAMKDRRHIQWHLLASHERHQRIRDAVGSGDETVYFIDDGAHHVMVGRRIGAVDGECEYCLVGRVSLDRYESLRSGEATPLRSFEGAAEITLCGVAQEEGIISSNVFDVARYGGEDEVPVDFLPGAPYHHFESALEITVG